jgi:hypothetical protein
MPKKSKKKRDHKLLLAIGALIALVIAWALVSAFFDLIYNFVVANPWIYLVLPAIAIIVLVLRNQDQKKQKAEQEKRLQQEKEMQGQQIQQMLDHNEAERKTQEDNRVNGILAHKNEWGNEMCQWMIHNRINPYKPSTINIMSHYRDWGQDNCQHLLQQRIEPGMTDQMILAAYGNPPVIDEKESTAKDQRYRYVYGRPRRDATYIWFKNGVVIKIKQ